MATEDVRKIKTAIEKQRKKQKKEMLKSGEFNESGETSLQHISVLELGVKPFIASAQSPKKV